MTNDPMKAKLDDLIAKAKVWAEKKDKPLCHSQKEELKKKNEWLNGKK